MLRLLRVRYEANGPVPYRHHGPLLLVANHISWVDIILLLALLPARFVAKAEVRRWPVIGTLASRAGTLYLERDRRRHTMTIGHEIAAALVRGETIVVFPEGTTTDGARVLPFHGSLFEAARRAQAPIQPVAIRYRRHDGSRCTAAGYDGDKSILDTLWLMSAEPEIYAELIFLPPLAPLNQDRRELAQAATSAIASALGLPDPRRTPETAPCPPDAVP